MEGTRLLHTLRLANFLSYGPEGTEIELEPLNVLIGPNGSGKSNLIEAIGLLKAAPGDLSAPIRSGGGMREWLWKGSGKANPSPLEVNATVSYDKGVMPLRYRLQLAPNAEQVLVWDEAIENEAPQSPSHDDVYFFYRYQNGHPVLNVSEQYPGSSSLGGSRGHQRQLRREDIDPRQSILSQRKDPDLYPELTYLADVLSRIYVFRNTNIGPESPLRGPQRADQAGSFLLEGGGNLGLVLSNLLNRSDTRTLILEKLKRFCAFVEGISARIDAARVEIGLHEQGLTEATPSTRLSDGTLRYLCLLTILCHPNPPPLVCIEDPEIGLHPDILPVLAELLIEASQKMQLIVTTHSDVLVSSLGEVPEAVVICEKDEEGSHLKRLEPDRLTDWLEKYTLGTLWEMGELGGNP
ncbi:MAG: chromosome segregation protein SMC [Planctomycetes bacterium RBG_13_63_9]|nr:MAG: chromosome segregation protein SMC [Planctomycetes bacterium RBG_13_63_9]